MSDKLYRWVKASKRLPKEKEEGLIHFRTTGGLNDIVFYVKKHGFYNPKVTKDTGGKRTIEIIPLKYKLEEIEWLSEIEADQDDGWIYCPNCGRIKSES